MSYSGTDYIVGALTDGTTATSRYGDISWWTGTFTHKSFILANAPGARFVSPTVVPLPSAAWAGLGLLGVLAAARRYRKHAAA